MSFVGPPDGEMMLYSYHLSALPAIVEARSSLPLPAPHLDLDITFTTMQVDNKFLTDRNIHLHSIFT